MEDDHHAGAVDIKGKVDDQLLREIVSNEYRFSRLGLFVGALFMIAGVLLFVLGISTKSNVLMSVLGMQFSINDAAPGLVFSVVGAVLVYWCRPQVSIHDTGG